MLRKFNLKCYGKDSLFSLLTKTPVKPNTWFTFQTYFLSRSLDFMCGITVFLEIYARRLWVTLYASLFNSDTCWPPLKFALSFLCPSSWILLIHSLPVSTFALAFSLISPFLDSSALKPSLRSPAPCIPWKWVWNFICIFQEAGGRTYSFHQSPKGSHSPQKAKSHCSVPLFLF